MTQLDTLREADLPVLIDRFCLLELLGEGGMGRVFRAEIQGSAGFRKQCALKVLRTDADGPLAGRDAFINEARLGGLLNHPNIVSTLDFGDFEGRPYIAMELVDGVTVDRLLWKVGGALPPSVALDLAIQVCEGLDHAHDLAVNGKPANLVHRDLKPSNVIVSRHGVAKVLDFGIAKAADRIGEHTRTGLTKGTPNYMSPEQIDGKPLDRRSDIFVMGSLIYALLTGQPFFRTESGGWLSVLRAISRVEEIVEEGDRLDEVEGSVPGIGAIISRCLREDPDQRYARAGDLGEALLELRDGLDTPTSLAAYIKQVYAEEMASGVQPARPLYRLSTDTRDQRGAGQPADDTSTQEELGTIQSTEDYPTSAATVATPSSMRMQPEPTRSDAVLQAPDEPTPARPSIARRAWWIPVVAGSALALVLLTILLIAVVAGLSRKATFVDAGSTREPPDTAVVAAPMEPELQEDGLAVADAGAMGQARGAGAQEVSGDAPPPVAASPSTVEHDPQQVDAAGVADVLGSAVDPPATPVEAPPPATTVEEQAPLVIEAVDTPGRASAGFERSFQVRVTGCDDAEVSLMLRSEGGDWQLHRLAPSGDGTWTGSVAITADMVGSAQYYFHARRPGEASSRVQLGSRNAPFSLQVW